MMVYAPLLFEIISYINDTKSCLTQSTAKMHCIYLSSAPNACMVSSLSLPGTALPVAFSTAFKIAIARLMK